MIQSQVTNLRFLTAKGRWALLIVHVSALQELGWNQIRRLTDTMNYQYREIH